ncbi:MAG: hypothetical protein ACKV1O_05655 [Saprospiraceae bacterium]
MVFSFRPKGINILSLLMFLAIAAIGQSPAELRELQDKVLAMNLEIADLETKWESTESLIQMKEQTILVLKKQMAAKDVYIKQLKNSLATAETLIERQKIRTTQLEQLRLKDSIRYTTQIAQQTEDMDEMREIYEQAVKEYEEEIARLERLIIERTFVITGQLKSAGITGTRPESPILLDEKNNYRVRARRLGQVYLNFESSKPVKDLPEFYYSVEFLDSNGKKYTIISDVPVNRSSKVEQQIDFEGAGNGHKLQQGKYKVILTYEENQTLIKNERVFTLN